MTEVEAALAVVADLQQQRAAAEERQTAAAETRKRTAFAALAHGDAEARAALKVANDATIAAATEIASFDAALAEAHARVDAAQRAEAAEAQREAMRAVPPITEKVRQRAAFLDELLRNAVDEYAALLADMHELRIAGFDRPDPGLVKVNASRAAQAAFLGSDLETERVPPGSRRTFAQLAESWTAPIDAEARAIIGTEQRAA